MASTSASISSSTSASTSTSTERQQTQAKLDESQILRKLFGQPNPRPRSYKFTMKPEDLYTPNSSGLCDLPLTPPSSIMTDRQPTPQEQCGKLCPVLYAPVHCELPDLDWFSKEYMAGPIKGELIYPVLVMFHEVAKNDRLLAHLYRNIGQVNAKMAHYYRKMAIRNRCQQRKLLRKPCDAPIPSVDSERCLRNLNYLSELELELVEQEKKLIEKEKELFKREHSAWLDSHELPDHPAFIVRSQEVRRFAELERQAAWVERAHGVHLRLSCFNDYNLTKNEHQLVLKQLELESREAEIVERTRCLRRLERPLITKIRDSLGRCCSKTASPTNCGPSDQN